MAICDNTNDTTKPLTFVKLHRPNAQKSKKRPRLITLFSVILAAEFWLLVYLEMRLGVLLQEGEGFVGDRSESFIVGL